LAEDEPKSKEELPVETKPIQPGDDWPSWENVFGKKNKKGKKNTPIEKKDESARAASPPPPLDKTHTVTANDGWEGWEKKDKKGKKKGAVEENEFSALKDKGDQDLENKSVFVDDTASLGGCGTCKKD
jgi:hypothetical protein